MITSLINRDFLWQWAYQEKFKEAGLTAILGSGFDPEAGICVHSSLAKPVFPKYP